ncbi:uncharacterized protein PGTG_18408 [Puccinia graminis f. sp. tritici CRL 75-36-700-3]|uniref:Uncharacterized protein n=1 Tax=Puccinia graminis f. sp. tritici (strain CRL 75-36-700-3 / race SCCL) TaxID=418459 RepID=E3L5Y2_PUCGT|nr:uncharacterized protein PGTG_18408 [Puccinia graminis f. sp. tritici CRL 75-36-700-3]EFP91957.1 hypothetical protein PGTG_18408 [Puccinia graminis f. sp. tritici CRL 75-36-700-3]
MCTANIWITLEVMVLEFAKVPFLSLLSDMSHGDGAHRSPTLVSEEPTLFVMSPSSSTPRAQANIQGSMMRPASLPWGAHTALNSQLTIAGRPVRHWPRATSPAANSFQIFQSSIFMSIPIVIKKSREKGRKWSKESREIAGSLRASGLSIASFGPNKYTDANRINVRLIKLTMDFFVLLFEPDQIFCQKVDGYCEHSQGAMQSVFPDIGSGLGLGPLEQRQVTLGSQ